MDDLVPLGKAAVLAHDRLFPGHQVKDSKTLDLLALAVSALIPLYRRDARTNDVEELSAALISAGRFTRGATRLEFSDRPPLGSLMVSRADLGAALEKLARDAQVAARLAPISSRRRPPPECSSARGP
jgi:hypothetical protein